MARKKSIPEASAPAVDSEPMELEKAMEELTLIVNQLEIGNGSLEESLRQYERGIQLLRACHGKLDAAAHRIEVLSSGMSPDEPIRTKSFDGRTTLSQDSSRQRTEAAAMQIPESDSDTEDSEEGGSGNLF